MEYIPLSKTQLTMLRTEQVYSGTAVSNISACIRLPGNTDLQQIGQWINEWIKQNESVRFQLRMTSAAALGDHAQYVQDYVYHDVPIINLVPADLAVYANYWAKSPLPLYGKLYDFVLLDCSKSKYLLVKFHHIIADAWSVYLFVSSLDRFLGEPSATQEAAPSYRFHIKNEQDYLSGKRHLRDRDFWTQYMSDYPFAATLSAKQNQSPDIAGGRKSFILETQTAEAILSYCDSQNVSLSVFFEAVISIYACRFNRTSRIPLCSMVQNRDGIIEKSTFGMFSNIIPVTGEVSGSMTFNELCQSLVSHHLSLYRHQKYPYDELLSQGSGHDSQNLPYDIMVSFQNAEYDLHYVKSVSWLFNGCSELGIMFNISKLSSNRINLDIDYQTAKYSATDIQNIYNRLSVCITHFLSDPYRPVSSVGMATDAEKERILVDFNRTEKEFPKDQALVDFLNRNAECHPDQVCMSFKGERLTYAEFKSKAGRLSQTLQQYTNGRTGLIVGILALRSFDMMTAIYAVLEAGCAYMPIDPSFPADRIGFMIKDSNAPVILADADFVSLVPEGLPVVNLSTFSYGSSPTPTSVVSVKPTDLAYVIYTSGSTGQPKGAMIPHYAVVNRIKWMHDHYPMEPGDIVLQKTPYTFDVSVWELFWWSMYGRCVHILAPNAHKDPKAIIQAISTHSVTHIHFVPSMLHAFLEYLRIHKESLPLVQTLKYVFVSGEALQTTHVRDFYQLFNYGHTKLINLYGPTECTVDVSFYECKPNDIPDMIPIGKPIDNIQLLVLDQFGHLCPPGMAGELYISGVGVGYGYLNREALTAEKFRPNPFSQTYKTMYQTGDLARFTDNGDIEYLGRTDFQVKIHGLRVELGDIESALLRHPEIHQVCVTANSYNGDQLLCAYYVSEGPLSDSSLRNMLLATLPEYMVPSCFIHLDHIPVNLNGKLDRKLLPQPDFSSAQTAEYVAPQNPVEAAIQKQMTDVLHLDTVSCAENLFHYGLTSIGIITAITYLSVDGYNLSVDDFYAQKTIINLAALITDPQLHDSDSKPFDDSYDQQFVDISDIHRKHSAPLNSATGTLVTGASGYLGVHIVSELWHKHSGDIWCLVRSREKFNTYLTRYTQISPNDPRLHILFGDVSAENFGLDATELENLFSCIHAIIHCAASVSFFGDWERIRKINHLGTCHAIQLAERWHAKLHHISTLTVSGDLLVRQQTAHAQFSEKQLFIGQAYQDNVYVHSKYLAEREIIQAIRDNRINASIYRVANLTWRLSDGLFQPNYKENDLYNITTTLLNLGTQPQETYDENLELIPVDECSASICAVLDHSDNLVLHLYSGNSVTAGHYLQTLGIKSTVPYSDFIQALFLRHDDPARFTLMYLAGIKTDVFNSIVAFDNRFTSEVLLDSGFEWKPIPDDYIKEILRFEKKEGNVL